MNRRRFFRTLTGTALAAPSIARFVPFASAAPAVLRARTVQPVIERITVLRVPGSFYRPIAMNAYDRAPKGKDGSIDLVRLELSDGTVGLGERGYVRFDEEVSRGLRRLIGKQPEDLYVWEGDRISGYAPEGRTLFEDMRYAWVETPLLDALGHLHGRPVYTLFGSSIRDGIDCYDGTLYFTDVMLDRDASAIGEVAARIKADGYRAIKMKVGRPYKWMEGEAGLERDIEAFIAAREAVGANFNLMADANNGYQGHFDWAVRFLEACDPYDMYWIEEIFPESTDDYRRLRSVMAERGITTRIADGENAIWGRRAIIQGIDGFDEWLRSRLLDVIQPDMRTVGFSNVVRQAAASAEYGASLVPHNWQSEIGKIMSLHAAKIRSAVRFAEDDRWSNYALDTSDFVFRDGQWYVPETPGWGVRLSEMYDRFATEGEVRVIEA